MSTGPPAPSGAPAPDWLSTIDQQVSQIVTDPPAGLDRELADAYTAAAVGLRECTRLIAAIPHLWYRPDDYLMLAERVRQAADSARTAYLAAEVRLLRAGPPNPLFDALNGILTVRTHAPARFPDGVGRQNVLDWLNEILTRLQRGRHNHFPPNLLGRMREQVARTPAVAAIPPEPPATSGEHVRPTDTSPPMTEGADRAKRKKAKMPLVPQKYKAAVKLWPKYKAELLTSGKRAKIEGFRRWLAKRPKPILLDDDYARWWNNTYSPQLRRSRS